MEEEINMEIFINGKSIGTRGRESIVIHNGDIIVDGESIHSNCDGHAEVTIKGDVNNINCTVTVNGNVTGSIDCGGSCNCFDAAGDVDCGGWCKCGNVSGDVDAGVSVSMNK